MHSNGAPLAYQYQRSRHQARRRMGPDHCKARGHTESFRDRSVTVLSSSCPLCVPLYSFDVAGCRLLWRGPLCGAVKLTPQTVKALISSLESWSMLLLTAGVAFCHS
jgi:hypothetical protein